MNTKNLRAIFLSVLSAEVIGEIAAKHQLQIRFRKKDVVKLITALVLAAADGDGGRQAVALKKYFAEGGPKVSRSAAYEWFDEKLALVLRDLAEHCFSIVRQQKVDLPGFLGKYVPDWLIVDSTTVKLDERLKSFYLGCGDYAAIKVHKTMSLGIGTVVDYHVSPAREHDSQHLTINENWRGKGLIADLAYASFDTFQACSRYDVRFVLRLKSDWLPKVQEINRGTVKKALGIETELDIVLTKNIVLDGKAIDLSATIQKDGETLPVRISGICSEKGEYHLFITNLPKKVGPNQVSDIYRCRWEIEMDNKTNKSYFSLDEIQSYTPDALHAMIHAAIIGSMTACLLAHAHSIALKPETEGDEVPVRDYPPLHPKLIARYLSSSSSQIAAALTLTGEDADREWDKICGFILEFGKDINWRSRPSILDQLRGWPAPSNRKYPRKRA